MAGVLSKMNVSSSCRQVEEDLFILSFQKLAVIAQMFGTSGQCPELLDTERNFRRISGTSGKTFGTSGPTSSDTLKVLQEQFGVRTKLLDTLMG